MYWKLRGKAFAENKGEQTRQMQKAIVESGVVPGLLAYVDDVPGGWIAVEPRAAYERLAHSRILKSVDDADVWSVTCFFVAKGFRRQGLTTKLLQAAVQYVKEQGGQIVEGYPIDTDQNMPDPFVYTGTASAFRNAGFIEVARRSGKRPIFRYMIGD